MLLLMALLGICQSLCCMFYYKYLCYKTELYLVYDKVLSIQRWYLKFDVQNGTTTS